MRKEYPFTGTPIQFVMKARRYPIQYTMTEFNPDNPELPIEEAVPKAKPFWRDLLEIVILGLGMFFLINFFTARVRVENISMLPTLHEGELLVVSKLAYRFEKPSTGDIIVFHNPENPRIDLIKRVIGTPGDTVSVAEGKVTVNGQVLDEPYIAAAPDYYGSWIIPEDKLFVLGDNRNNSNDSHDWGYVPMQQVVGKAVLVYWPINEFEVIRHEKMVVN
jgi:signal peptidase I